MRKIVFLQWAFCVTVQCLIFVLALSAPISCVGCNSSGSSDTSSSDLIENDFDDDLHISDDDSVNDDANDDLNDDADDDSVDDDGDDDMEYLTPPFIRPDLPINAFHMAATHNTFIWKGFQGILTRVSSMAVIEALDKNQRFIELDFDGPTEEGDFILNHGETQTVKLSSVFRNIRWWSDTHPHHEMIVLGGNWRISHGDEGRAILLAMIEEFFNNPSPISDRSPLFSLQDWLEFVSRELDDPTRVALFSMTPAELSKVVGYPTIRSLRGKILIEAGGETYDQLPSFFRMGEDGHFDNHDENYLDEIPSITQIRMDQRLTRIYTGGFRIYSGNFNIFEGFSAGVTNNALNMEWTDGNSPSVYSFSDEFVSGFAPAGYVQSFGNAPPRLGPPVYVSAFSAENPHDFSVRIEFDTVFPISSTPLIACNILIQGLSGNTQANYTFDDANIVNMFEQESPSVLNSIALPPNRRTLEFQVHVGGDPIGYELFLFGPTLSNVEIHNVIPGNGGMIWVSPTFTPVDIELSDRCTSLSEGGVRVYGRWDGALCDASPNPSFMIGAFYQ